MLLYFIILSKLNIVQVLGWHLRPIVYAVLDGNAHATLEMALDVAMHEPGARVVDVVPNHHPRGPGKGGRGDEAIAPWRIDEIEACGDLLSGLGDVVPLEEAVPCRLSTSCCYACVSGAERHCA
jgi:hypothetical protein